MEVSAFLEEDLASQVEGLDSQVVALALMAVLEGLI